MEIEKNIPIPPQFSRTKWPFIKMEVGDSVFFEGGDWQSPAVSAATSMANRTNKKFSIRRESGGIRIWRVK